MTARRIPAGERAAVVLFTRDLRVRDHEALTEAVQTHDVVAPLFVFDDRLLRSTRSPNRIQFLLESLADLRQSLRGLGGDLIVRRGDPVRETVRLARNGPNIDRAQTWLAEGLALLRE